MYKVLFLIQASTGHLLNEWRVKLDALVFIILAIVFLAVWFIAGWFINSKLGKEGIAAAEEKSKKILEEAEKEANNLKREKLLEVKEEWHKKKQEFENEANQRKLKLQTQEKNLQQKEELVDKKNELLTKKEKELVDKENQLLAKVEELKQQEANLAKLQQEYMLSIEKVAGMSQEEAKNILMEKMIEDAKTDAAKYIKDIREQAKLEARKEAQKIVVQAIQRTAVDHSVETTVSVVQIQNDEMKGRIIGREGRNIRSFEAATGVDVIVDDTPEAVILSSFDQFRREVARISLERLIADGRIHPARIEEVVEKVRQELDEEIYKVGESTLFQLQISGMNPELIKFVGRMKYRSSYGQNLLQHSIECAYLAGYMAAELGLDVALAKRAALLHDIGKTVENEVGPHALLGMEVAKKYKEHPIVVNAIGSHHEDIEMEHPIAVLVQAADAISGARPGARREPLETYVKRLENLENMAKSFEGVAKTYAIQAGREIRVVVEPEKVDDDLADRLSIDIANKIQEEMEYPGQIKVTVIREVRKVSYAK